MSDKKQWHSWVIKRNRYENVIGHIRENVPEIDKYFYPLVKKEYQTKRGVRVKDRPLYEGYLFVRYDNHDEVFHKMSQYPFVTTYAGLVSDDEIAHMQEAQGKLLTEIKTSRFTPDETVVLLDGPFKDFEGKVTAVEGDVVKVQVDAQLLGKAVEMVFQEDSLERKSELQNTEVQDI
jgi:transcription antitermination factor NusG